MKDPALKSFLEGKSERSILLFHHFVDEFRMIGEITIHPAKTMIGLATSRKRIVYITQFGKSFLHVVFPFKKPYPNNFCFQKIAQVPDDNSQFNHHFRMIELEDVNDEVRSYMKLAYDLGL